MSDIFLEQIVKQQKSVKQIVRNCLIILVGLIIACALLPFSLFRPNYGPFVFLVFAGVLYYTWYIVSGLNLEFEYIFTNGDLDVDKISNKRKRKRMTSIRISKISLFSEFDAAKFDKKAFDVVYEAAQSVQSEQNYMIQYANRKDKKCVLIFTPNEKLVEAIRKYYRPGVHAL